MKLSSKQNQQFVLDRIAASSFLFSRYKLILGVSFFISVVLVSLFTLLSILLNSKSVANALGFEAFDISGWVVSFSLIVVVFSKTFISYYLEDTKELAVKLQDSADRWLFGIKKNEFLYTDEPSEQEVFRYSQRYISRSGCEPVKNWYSSAVDGLPTPYQALICQNACLSWDGSLRRRYNIVLILMCVFIFVGLAGIACALRLPFDLIAKNMVAVIAPVFDFGFSIYRSNCGSLRNSQTLNGLVSNCIEKALDDADVSEVAACAANVQDHLYLKRITDTPIPDFFYDRFRSEQQEEMGYSSSNLAKEFFSINNRR